MATQREIKNRITSIKNTKKITSTMEMVATAKMKKMQQRLEMSKPYEVKVDEIIMDLLASGMTMLQNPLFRKVAEPSRILVLQITGNRGLCGSYNTHVINNSLSFKDELEDEGREVLLYNIGKKGANFLKFIKEPVFKSVLNMEEKLSYDDAAALGNELAKLFISGEVHEVYISYTKVLTSASQKPEIIKLLPIVPEIEESDETDEAAKLGYIFEPNPNRILNYLLPLYMKVKIFTCFLESSYSEQFARRVAMKNATDASSDMIRELTISYNRARQAKITTEITEIVGGAAALE